MWAPRATCCGAGCPRIVGDGSWFLQQRELAAGQLSAEVVEDFFAGLHADRGSRWQTPKSLGWLVEYLREAGVAPAPFPAPPRSPEEELAGRYRRYLVDERGLSRKTVIARERTARVITRSRPEFSLTKVPHREPAVAWELAAAIGACSWRG